MAEKPFTSRLTSFTYSHFRIRRPTEGLNGLGGESGRIFGLAQSLPPGARIESAGVEFATWPSVIVW
jgi:hypothetical protein